MRNGSCYMQTIWYCLQSLRSKEEVEQKFLEWKLALETRGMKVNLGKTKLMGTGEKGKVIRSGRYPCGVSGRGVGLNSILCSLHLLSELVPRAVLGAPCFEGGTKLCLSNLYKTGCPPT